jgi:predicted alpha/beta-hydrolase family hydrolase
MSGGAPGGTFGLILAPGAGAGQRHPFMVGLARRFTDHGVDVVTFDFPYAEARRRRPDPPAVLEQCWRDAIENVQVRIAPRPDQLKRTTGSPRLFIGGKSMGGRLATHVAAEAGGAALGLAGVVCFGYPLRPPGRASGRSVDHFARLGVPLLVVQGTRDSFGSPEDVRTAAGDTAGLEVLPVEGADHGFTVRRSKDSLGDILELLVTSVVAWMHRAAGPVDA